jgi:penicillin-binding protein 1A
MGINSELRITRSLPLGASEVTVIDQAAGYAALASGGFKTTPYGFTQIITSQGDIIYDRRRDAPPTVRVLDEQTVAAMNGMLSQVPEWGTGRRAKLEGIKTAGKTGTASAYRDAWFIGYTGNYTAAVWMGNDDFSSTRRLTGGVLPAQIWNRFMTFAHAGIDLKPIPFVDSEPSADEEIVAAGDAGAETAGEPDTLELPTSLSEATTERLIALEEIMRNAPSLRPVAGLWPPSPAGLSAAPKAVDQPIAIPSAEPIGPPLFPIVQ